MSARFLITTGLPVPRMQRGLATPLIRWVVAHRLAVCRDVINCTQVPPSGSAVRWPESSICTRTRTRVRRWRGGFFSGPTSRRRLPVKHLLGYNGPPLTDATKHEPGVRRAVSDAQSEAAWRAYSHAPPCPQRIKLSSLFSRTGSRDSLTRRSARYRTGGLERARKTASSVGP